MWLLIWLSQVLVTSSLRFPLLRIGLSSRKLSSSLSLTNFQDVTCTQSEYFANVTIGTPPQSFSVILDTASAYIYIPSTQCDHSCWGAFRFDSSKSTTFRMLPAGPVGETSRGAIIDGFLCGEAITMGPFSADNVTFVLANSMTMASYQRYEGLIVTSTQGFGFPELNNNIPTFIDKLMEQGVITQRTFSFYFSQTSFTDTEYDLNSAVVIGEVDTSYADGDLEYIPLSGTPAFWSVKLGGATSGSNSIMTDTGIAIFDTATSKIVVPQVYFSSIMQSLSAAGECQSVNTDIYCDCGESYPALSVTLGKSVYTLESDYYLGEENDGTCKLLIVGGEAPYWVLGQAFLRKYYTVYDMDGERVGIALAVSMSKALQVAFIGIFSLILA